MSSSSSSAQPSSSDAPRRGIKLTRAAQTRFTANTVDGFRFTVTAAEPVLMPAEIFLYLRRPADPHTGAEADEFQSICSVPDLEEYPTGGPVQVPQFFRDSVVDLVFRSMHEADEAWRVIQRDVQVLVDTLNLNDDLGAGETVEIGG